MPVATLKVGHAIVGNIVARHHMGYGQRFIHTHALHISFFRRIKLETSSTVSVYFIQLLQPMIVSSTSSGSGQKLSIYISLVASSCLVLQLLRLRQAGHPPRAQPCGDMAPGGYHSALFFSSACASCGIVAFGAMKGQSRIVGECMYGDDDVSPFFPSIHSVKYVHVARPVITRPAHRTCCTAPASFVARL